MSVSAFNDENDNARWRHVDLLDHTVALTSEVIRANGSNIGYEMVPAIIKAIYAGLANAAQPVTPVAAPEPVVPTLTKKQIDDAVQPDSIFCFENGKRYKSMKRTLALLGLTPRQYREKWNLPDDFPMVAPAYSAARSAMAKKFGLGVKR